MFLRTPDDVPTGWQIIDRNDETILAGRDWLSCRIRESTLVVEEVWDFFCP